MTSPTLFKEYIWLVNTIAKVRRITFSDINDRWCETEMSGGVEIARATFNRHRKAIADIFGIYIDCHLPYAYYRVGESYELGRGVAQDLEAAKENYRIAYREGHPLARKKLQVFNFLR